MRVAVRVITTHFVVQVLRAPLIRGPAATAATGAYMVRDRLAVMVLLPHRVIVMIPLEIAASGIDVVFRTWQGEARWKILLRVMRR